MRGQQNRNGGHGKVANGIMFSTSFSGLSFRNLGVLDLFSFGLAGCNLEWITDYGVTSVHPRLIYIYSVAISDNNRDNPMRKIIKLLTIKMNDNIIW